MALFASAFLLLAGCAGTSQELEQAQPMTLAPGTNASTPLSFEDPALDASQLSASASGGGLEATVEHVNETEDGLTAWLTVSASQEADEGPADVQVSLADEQRSAPVTVQTPEDPLEEGEQANLTLTAVTAEGEVVITNDERVADLDLPKAEGYQEPESFDPIPVPLTPGGQLPGALVEGLVGVDVGQRIAVDVPEFYGPEENEQPRPREEPVARETSAPSEVEGSPAELQRFVPPDAQEGDEVEIPATQQGQMLPYVVEEKTQENMRLVFAADEGENVTLQEIWPDAAQVTEIGDEEISLYLDPDVEEGDELTWVDPWGNVSEVVSITDEEITIRHSPEVGTTYEEMDPRSQQRVTSEIVDVTEEEVLVTRENPHPLAGQTVTFDITVEDRSEMPAPTQPQPGSGR